MNIILLFIAYYTKIKDNKIKNNNIFEFFDNIYIKQKYEYYFDNNNSFLKRFLLYNRK